MSLGDITYFSEGPFGNPGTKRFVVHYSGTAATINPGEPVVKPQGTAGTSVTAMATNKPLMGTDFIAGISQSYSTETATADGVVDVYDVFAEGSTWLISPNSTTAWDTQAEYDALVGSQVLIDKTNGAYTILATNQPGTYTGNVYSGLQYGCVIEPLDISKHPGKVRFSFRRGLNYAL